MILYNVTVGIDTGIEDEWLEWMRSDHIPRVMATGFFSFHKIFRLLSHEEEGTISYSIQYFSDSIEKVDRYLKEFAPGLAEAHRQKFLNRHVAFRTLLEEVK